ncbi:uncharacterized protein [Ambystoma mexicanum]|uniref:uncharacterized protein n=1 Tax=Ambystoma mexicanum TaxID=8296 RepID=UPI0037E8B054
MEGQGCQVWYEQPHKTAPCEMHQRDQRGGRPHICNHEDFCHCERASEIPCCMSSVSYKPYSRTAVFGHRIPSSHKTSSGCSAPSDHNRPSCQSTVTVIPYDRRMPSGRSMPSGHNTASGRSNSSDNSILSGQITSFGRRTPAGRLTPAHCRTPSGHNTPPGHVTVSGQCTPFGLSTPVDHGTPIERSTPVDHNTPVACSMPAGCSATAGHSMPSCRSTPSAGHTASGHHMPSDHHTTPDRRTPSDQCMPSDPSTPSPHHMQYDRCTPSSSHRTSSSRNTPSNNNTSTRSTSSSPKTQSSRVKPSKHSTPPGGSTPPGHSTPPERSLITRHGNTPSVRKIQLLFQPRGDQRNQEDKVWPKLYLGNVLAAMDIDNLRALGITHILNAAHHTKGVHTDAHYYRGLPFTYFGLKIFDERNFDISCFFGPALKFIDIGLRTPGGKVLVHCFKGKSRSATLVLAYLMVCQNMTLVDAIRTVSAKRHISPNEGFIRDLRNLDRKLEKKRAKNFNLANNNV